MKIIPIILAWALLLPLGLGAQTLGQPLPKVQGLVVKLDEDKTVNMQVVDHKLVLYFMDKDGVLIAPPFEKVIVELEEAHGDKNIHLVLRPDGQVPYLTHPRTIPPPLRYRARMLLYPHDGSDEGRVLVTERNFVQKVK